MVLTSCLRSLKRGAREGSAAYPGQWARAWLFLISFSEREERDPADVTRTATPGIHRLTKRFHNEEGLRAFLNEPQFISARIPSTWLHTSKYKYFASYVFVRDISMLYFDSYVDPY